MTALVCGLKPTPRIASVFADSASTSSPSFLLKPEPGNPWNSRMARFKREPLLRHCCHHRHQRIISRLLKMEKIVFLSDSDDTKAREKGDPSSWYTVIHDTALSIDLTKQNPWNTDEAIYEKRCYLLDDCVVSLRPARYEERISKQHDHNKGLYFLEIANQEGSQVFTSRSVYTWDALLGLIGIFKGLSFTAATRVWKVKKL